MPNFIKQDTVAIISAPFSGGQAKGGVDQGPSHLLKAGLESQIKGLNWKTVIEEPSFSQFHSNKSHPLGIKNAYTVSDVTKVISDLVFKHASSGSLPLVFQFNIDYWRRSFCSAWYNSWICTSVSKHWSYLG